MVASRRSAQPLAVRGYGPPAGTPGTGKGDKIKDAVTNILNTIQDKMPAGTQPGGVGRKPGDEWTQYSKMNDVVQYGAYSNADTVEDNVTEKNIKEQSDWRATTPTASK